MRHINIGYRVVKQGLSVYKIHTLLYNQKKIGRSK
jgi:hypothetical protein